MKNTKKKEDLLFGDLETRRIKLDKAFEILKEEFVGLDEILDQIKTSITPWYFTPEIIQRPVIISLWGMTGTGKTSVVNRLSQLLDLTDRTISYDVGSISNGTSLAERIGDKLYNQDISLMPVKGANVKEDPCLFIFDEFQFARTKNEDGKEVDSTSLRTLWSLLDSGKIDYMDGIYFAANFNIFVRNFSEFAMKYPNMKIEKGHLNNISDIKLIMKYLGEKYYEGYYDSVEEKLDEKKKKPFSSLDHLEAEEVICGNRDTPRQNFHYPPLDILYNKRKNFIRYSNLLTLNSSEGILERLDKCTTIIELLPIFQEVKKIFNLPRELNFSDSLIFILGNLDEAFQVSDEIDPDINADVICDLTSKVSISDIKFALNYRFRPEQIARFGNNIIKYPTLSSNSFRQIITKELLKIFKKFKLNYGIEITSTENILELIYSEGVYPTQGIRPVFTTITSIITPIISSILVNLPEPGWKGEVVIDLDRVDDWNINKLRIPSTNLRTTFKDINKSFLTKVPLTLGPLRDPSTRRSRYLAAVHEAGHAILSIVRAGVIPSVITSVAANGGGFCDCWNPKNNSSEVSNRYDIQTDVMISLAGYVSESLVFVSNLDVDYLQIKSNDLQSTGSSIDLQRAWRTLSTAVYKQGYFDIIPHTCAEVETSFSGIPNGSISQTKEINDKITTELIRLTKEVELILKSESKLLQEISILLGKEGTIVTKDVEKLIKDYGKTVTLESIAKLEDAKFDYYEDVLINRFPLN